MFLLPDLARAASAAAYSAGGNTFRLASGGVDAEWSLDGGVFRMASLSNRISGTPIPIPAEPFTLHFADGTVKKASEFQVVHGPNVDRQKGTAVAARLSDRLGAVHVTLELREAQTGTRVTWRGIASDGAQYLRQELTIAPEMRPLPVRSVYLFEWKRFTNVETIGFCDGSPLVAGSVFAAIEHPYAQTDSLWDGASAWFPNKIDLQPGRSLTLRSVIGATRPGQLRRDFLTYVERERAHPYRTFLHYNSWYDIGYFTRYNQDDCLSRIHAFGEELHRRRGVKLMSYLFDDGWDDPNRLWQYNPGFPDGFRPLGSAASAYGAGVGAWLSPWGGYGKPRDQRLAAAKREGYEIDADGLALSGPKYYSFFESVVNRFLDQGVNQFKIDGTGSASTVYPGSRFDNNFEAAIALIGEMRERQPGIYINLTTGTYPSPFWLRYCDSIWRGGNDHDFTGVGTPRQRWITYRDADTYAGVVTQGPLYPLNSLMLHGLLFAQHAYHLNDDPGGDFPSEVRSYFGNGTQLQEMYVTPALLGSRDWDEIAQAAHWSYANADVLRDTHWVGGDPYRLDVYGWASWSARKGILVLRNPSDRTKSIPVDLQDAFELPGGAPQRYRASSPWRDGSRTSLSLRAGQEHSFKLEPFEVLVLDVQPES